MFEPRQYAQRAFRLIPTALANCRIGDNDRVNTDQNASSKSFQSVSHRLELLKTLPPEAAESLLRRGSLRQYHDGATLVQRSHPLTNILILMRGRLRSMTTLPDGSEHLIRWGEPGEAFGVASVLTGLPFQVDLVASGTCEVRSIPGDAFIDAMRRDATVGLAVSRFLAARLSEMIDHVAAQAQGRLQDRLHATLHHLAAENGEKLTDGRIRLRVTQQDISDAVGASRQRVNEALHSLQRAGQVQIGYRQITLTLPSQKPVRVGG
jgi:CRP/FNR family transcriptional regulator, cyclic AMP receptor protein